MEQQVTSALNRHALDAVNLLGGSDGPALQQLIEDYFCGEEQDEELPDSMLCSTIQTNNCSKYNFIFNYNR